MTLHDFCIVFPLPSGCTYVEFFVIVGRYLALIYDVKIYANFIHLRDIDPSFYSCTHFWLQN